MKPSRIVAWVLAVSCQAFILGLARAQETTPVLKTRNVILVVSDGLRWQEIFRGADPSLLNKDAGVADPTALRREFDRPTVEARRKALFPFLWGRVAQSGQLFGNADHGATARVTNGKNFSYPGYNELFTGHADPRIDSNDKVTNPNVTVLEWLAGQPGFEGRVAAYGSWDVFPYILARGRSRFRIVAGWETPLATALSPRQAAIAEITRSIHRQWGDCCYDALTFLSALDELEERKPRLLFLGLGETDEHAHEGRYDHYLEAARRFDEMLARLWEQVESMPEYRDKTTLLVTADHGRGDAPLEWRSHGARVKGSERIWLAALGPDTPARGSRTGVTITQNQIAATIAALLGKNYRAFAPQAAPPIRDLLPAPLTDRPSPPTQG